MRKSGKSRKAAMALAGDLALAPAVMMLRLPLLAAEAGRSGVWPAEAVAATTEKFAAAAEGMAAAQASIAVSASRFWFELAAGRMPSLVSGVALERAAQAAMAPSGKRVRRNHRRLNRP